jgi:SAM-dependent methyltransferase
MLLKSQPGAFVNDKKEKWDAAFRAFQQENPGATFGHYYAVRVSEKLAAEKAHPTIGARIKGGEAGEVDFRNAGAPRFRKFRKTVGLEPRHRVIDYGCGSLRVGLHLMKFLEAGNYFGLDVTMQFIDVGRKLIGADDVAAREPRLAAITPESLAEAATFEADFVFCNAVAMHVHPDEQEMFYGNLQKLTSAPGAMLYLNARISDTMLQYSHQCWSWPREHFIAALSELKLESQLGDNLLLFRRPG